MRNMMRGVIGLSVLTLFLTLRCVMFNPVAGGSSSETVVGKVVNADGSPACSTIVTLYPADYDPVRGTPPARASTDTTGLDGRYSVASDDSNGQYTIVATRVAAGSRALITGITITGDTAEARLAVLSEPGAIAICAPDSADIVNGYLYIPGTGLAVFINAAQGLIQLDQVPSGTIPMVTYASKALPGISSPVQSGIQVAPGDTTVIPLPQWRYSRRLYLNTTASGAGIAGNVTGFPVLIRLSSGNFPFTQAQAGGKDLRFSSSRGAILPYEIEEWDAEANTAAIWVKVPVVLGNNNSQYLEMHWGASTGSATPSLSNSAVVFDTARGFQGVWHFAGEGNKTAFDATANRYDGTPYNMTAASAVAGAIGPARLYNGSSTYITMLKSASGKLDMQQGGAYAISLWAYADTMDTLWHAIAGKGHEQYYLKLKCFGKGRGTWEFVEFQDQKGWEYTEDSIPAVPGPKQWVYITGVRSGTQQNIYINGQAAKDSPSLMTGNYSRNTGDNFTIGRHERQVTIPYVEGWCYFNGKIDEVRVMSFAPGADWIRLCYMNQKAADALVEFR